MGSFKSTGGGGGGGGGGALSVLVLAMNIALGGSSILVKKANAFINLCSDIFCALSKSSITGSAGVHLLTTGAEIFPLSVFAV